MTGSSAAGAFLGTRQGLALTHRPPTPPHLVLVPAENSWPTLPLGGMPAAMDANAGGCWGCCCSCSEEDAEVASLGWREWLPGRGAAMSGELTSELRGISKANCNWSAQNLNWERKTGESSLDTLQRKMRGLGVSMAREELSEEQCDSITIVCSRWAVDGRHRRSPNHRDHAVAPCSCRAPLPLPGAAPCSASTACFPCCCCSCCWSNSAMRSGETCSSGSHVSG